MLSSSRKDSLREASLPVKFRHTSKGGYLLLVASAVAWLVVVAAVAYESRRNPDLWPRYLVLGGVVTLVFAAVFMNSFVRVIGRRKSPFGEKAVRLPFVLHGNSEGHYGPLIIYGTLTLLSLSFMTTVLAFTVAKWDLDGEMFLLTALALIMSGVFATLLFSAWGDFRQGMSRLRVNHEGLQVLGSAHAREYCWSAIRKFRLNPTPLMLRMETEAGPDAFLRQEVAGNVKVVLNYGEFELPERYGMSSCDLRDLLNRARRIVVLGSDSPEGPEPFGSPGALTPVVQNEDLDSLRTSAEHLAAQGFSGSIVPLALLEKSERKSWLSPARGGYVLCLSVEQDIQKAMQVLAEHLKEHEEAVEQKEGAPC
ncbi:MAG: hypothetical protein WC712_05715 [Candidatus Brocadiia bacterium]